MAGVVGGGPSPAQAWWWRRYLGGPTGPTTAAPTAAAAPFPQSPLPIAVDLFLFDNWVEVTRLRPDQAGVYARDDISITRGRSAEGADVDPTEIRLTLNNRDGRFSPRNPTGLYYGQIGRNTQLRVRVGNDVRAVGEVSTWPVKWDVTGSDVWVSVEASGILRRLSQGASPLRSPLYRSNMSGTVLSYTVSGGVGLPVAYWPVEDSDGATQLASALPNGKAMVLTGEPSLSDVDSFPGSDSVATVAFSRWTGPVPAFVADVANTVGFLLSVPSGGVANTTVLVRVYTTGTAARWDIRYLTAGSGELQVVVYDAAGTLLFSSGAFAAGQVAGNPMQIEFRLLQAGADINIGFNWAGTTFDTSAGSGDGPIAGRTFGRVRSVIVGPDGNVDQVGVGHISVWNANAILAQAVHADNLNVSPMMGYSTETAGTRIARLCTEEEVPFTRVLPTHTSTAMGAQRSATLLDLLRECAQADQGVLFELRDTFGLAFLDRQGLYNRDAAVTLDYPSHQMGELVPVDDDQLVRNDWTVSRVNGSSSRQTLDTGALSTAAPPDGVGRYDDTVTINVAADTQLPDHAGWRLHLGTTDEARYPQIRMELASPAFAGDPALSATVAALDVGQRLDVTNPPVWLPPDDITQAVQGLGETLGTYEWTITANLTPESPWRVAVYDDTGDRYSSDGSTLAADATTTATSLSVTTPSGPLWTTDPADFPFDLRIGGERVTATAASGASSPQTFTVTRAANGVVKALPAGSAVELWQPAVYAI